jgi:hypothetical protein
MKMTQSAGTGLFSKTVISGRLTAVVVKTEETEQ